MGKKEKAVIDTTTPTAYVVDFAELSEQVRAMEQQLGANLRQRKCHPEPIQLHVGGQHNRCPRLANVSRRQQPDRLNVRYVQSVVL